MKLTKVLSFIFVLTSLVLLTSLQSCNDTPADIGLVTDSLNIRSISSEESDLILETKSIRVPQNSKVGQPYTPVGLAENLRAYTTIRYNEATIPDTLDYLESGDIQSASLYFFQGTYGFGDVESRNVDLSLYSINRTISLETEYSDLFAEDGSTDIKGDKVGELIYQARDFSSTISDPIIIDFSKEKIVEWLKFRKLQKQYFDSTLALSSSDSTTISEDQLNQIAAHFGYDREEATYINQIGMFPNEATNVIIRSINDTPLEFEDGKLVARTPFLEISYFDNNGTLDTFYIEPARTSYFVNNLEPNEEDFATRGIIAQRGIMDLNLSEISPYSSIHNATLELTIDRENSLVGSDGIDSIVNASVREEINGSLRIIGAATGFKVEGEDKIFFENFTDPIKGLLISSLSENQIETITFISTPYGNLINELQSFDKLSFYGVDNPDPEKRPKLKIIYSTWQD